MSPAQLLTEFGSNIAAALVAAFLLADAAIAALSLRVLFVALLGLFTGLDLHASYWTWYGFPTDYTLANIFNNVVAWTLAGLALAALIRPPSSPASAG